MLTSLRKNSSVSSFSMACFRCYIVYRVSFNFHLNVFLVPFCIRRIRGSLICSVLTADRGKGEQDWYVRRDFSFHEFYNFLLFLPTTFTHTHTHDLYPELIISCLYPLPTTHDIQLHSSNKKISFRLFALIIFRSSQSIKIGIDKNRQQSSDFYRLITEIGENR